MALPRLDYQRPDYIGGVAEAGAGLAKVVNDYSPADPRLANFLKRVYAGEDPRSVAVEAKLALQRHQTSPTPSASAPSMAPPPGGEAVGMRGSMRSSMPAEPGDVGSFTGPNEYTETETVTAPSPPMPRGTQPMMSEPATGDAFYSQAQPPILNKDLPALMQGAGLIQKDRKGDLGYLQYLLGVDRLNETTANRLGMQPGRDARTDATRATTANMPFMNQRKLNSEALRARGLDIQAGNLDTRRTENYLRGAGPSLEVTSGLGNLIQQGMAHPELVGTDGDFMQRRVAAVAGNLPLLGKFIESGLITGADEDLTPAQRDYKAQLAGELSTFIHSRYGSALSAHELAQARRIAGGEFSVASTLAGAQAIYYIAQRKWQLYQRAYPDAAQRVGTPTVGPPIPTGGPYPDGFGGPESIAEPGPAGPSLQEDLNNSLLNRGGR